jgi:hypothetical protein
MWSEAYSPELVATLPNDFVITFLVAIHVDNPTRVARDNEFITYKLLAQSHVHPHHQHLSIRLRLALVVSQSMLTRSTNHAIPLRPLITPHLPLQLTIITAIETTITISIVVVEFQTTIVVEGLVFVVVVAIITPTTTTTTMNASQTGLIVTRFIVD